jgi:hypothetical protein
MEKEECCNEFSLVRTLDTVPKIKAIPWRYHLGQLIVVFQVDSKEKFGS